MSRVLALAGAFVAVYHVAMCHATTPQKGTFRNPAGLVSSGLPLSEQIGNQIDDHLFDSTGDDTGDAKRHLNLMDANGDGSADVAEVRAFVKKVWYSDAASQESIHGERAVSEGDTGDAPSTNSDSADKEPAALLHTVVMLSAHCWCYPSRSPSRMPRPHPPRASSEPMRRRRRRRTTNPLART